MLHRTIVKTMLLNVFPTKVKCGVIEPSQSDLEASLRVLNEYWEHSSRADYGLETGWSTGSQRGGKELFDHTELDWLTHPIMEAAADYWRYDLNYRRDYHIYMDSMWANKHLEGDTTGPHCHMSGGRSKSHVSIVYYLKKTEHAGNLEFKNPLEQIVRMCPLNEDYDDWARDTAHHQGISYDWQEVDAKSYDYIIFPSWLKHRTQPSKGDRIAISINVAGCPVDPAEGDFD